LSKKKLNYSPRKSEFILLCLLLFVGVAALMLTYLVLPAWREYQDIVSRYELQQNQLESLKAEYSSLDELKSQAEEINGQLEGLRSRVPSYYSQEEIIASVNSISESSGLSLLNITFAGPVAQDRTTFLAGLSPTLSAGIASGSELVTSERVTASFIGSYDSLRSFIEAFELGTRQYCFRNITITGSEEGRITGTVTFLAFSMDDGSNTVREMSSYDYNAPEPQGRDNPFAAFESYSYGMPADTVSAAPDFYVIINSYDDNANKVQMGRYPVAATQIASDRNESIPASINISGSENKLSFSYKLGDMSYSGTFEHSGDTVNINILSRNRKNEDDNVGIIMNVTNDSDRKVVITVKNDDPVDPRFVLGTTSGAVQVIS
jgi:type IV pilus assembly protein PilO